MLGEPCVCGPSSDTELAQPGAWQMEEGPLLAPASESAMEMCVSLIPSFSSHCVPQPRDDMSILSRLVDE